MLANLDGVIPILSDQASQNQWALSWSWFAPKCIAFLSVLASSLPLSVLVVSIMTFTHVSSSMQCWGASHGISRPLRERPLFACKFQVSNKNDHVSQIVLLKWSLFMFILDILAVVWHKLILTLSSPFWVRAPSPTTSPTFWRRLSEGWMRSTWKIKPYQYILQIFAGEYWPRNRTRCIMIRIWAE